MENANYIAKGSEDALADLRQSGCWLDVIVILFNDQTIHIRLSIAQQMALNIHIPHALLEIMPWFDWGQLQRVNAYYE